MQKAIIGRKVGMTQLFAEDGKIIPVTVIQAGPCVVVQKKSVDKEGYNSVQLGFDDVPQRKLSKPEQGHLKKADVPYKRVLREFKLSDCESLDVGAVVGADTFAEGERVDVTGISKGKGFAGVVKRWGARMQASSHGVGPVHRSVGSMGANTDPSRVFPGKKMAGHMGNEQVTILNLDVVKVDTELGIIAVRGAIPGPRGGIVTLRNSVINE